MQDGAYDYHSLTPKFSTVQASNMKHPTCYPATYNQNRQISARQQYTSTDDNRIAARRGRNETDAKFVIAFAVLKEWTS